ncbi:NAD-dependent epimerase/dehydratase family protein [archaeon]|nr:MAG: NAD-dependent epimerase/dehydratase family protein [archaeon]
MHNIIVDDIKKTAAVLAALKPKIEGKTFLVTGGAGFIGSWFCDVAIEMGGKIICVDNLSSGSESNIKHLLANKNFAFFEKDVCSFSTNEKIDYIIHMAANASVPHYQKYPIESLDSNILGTRRMLELAKEKNAKGFLFTSTSEVYGNAPDHLIPTDENFYGCINSYGPRAMYDEGKRAAEAYCYSYFQKYKLPIRIARIFNTYGPRLDVKFSSSYGRALIKFVHQSLNNEPITVYGDGKQTRSFCYITDQLEGLFNLLLADGLDGEVVNIGNNRETSIHELAEKIIKIAKSASSSALNHPPHYDIRDDPRRRCPHIAKAGRLLSFVPKVHLEEGLERTIGWYRDAVKTELIL